jgi:hypothetical protein
MHRTAVAVGGDHILGANRFGLAGNDVLDETGDAVRVLLERDQLGRVAHRRPQLFGAGPNERLEALLGHEQARRWADRGDAFVEIGDVCGDLLARQRLHRVDAAIGIELLL